MATSRKTRRGGRSASVATVRTTSTQQTVQTQPAQPQPQPQPQQPPAPPPAVSQLNNIRKMTPDQQAAAITQAVSQKVPDHLNNDSDLQRFIYNIGANDKPDLVSDSQFKKTPGTTLYRTVDGVYDSTTDISFTAPQIAAQVQRGKVTRVSSGNRAAYGDGLYFASNRKDSTAYGSTTGNIQKTCVMVGKMKPGTKTIMYSAASSAVRNEINNGTKLGKALSKCDRRGAASIYAMVKGYDVITTGHSYYNILNRGALIMSDKVTAK